MNELETILDESLDLIKRGEATADEIVARYPEHATELHPLLRVASKLAKGGEVMPASAFRSSDRANLNSHMREHPQPRPVPSFTWRLTLAVATLMLLFFTSGTAFAQSALPGNPLYGWKLSSESAWRVISRDRLATDLTLSNRRVHELIALRDEHQRARVVANYERLLIRFGSIEDARAQERILPVLRSQQESLFKIGVIIPELDEYFLNDENPGSGSLPKLILISLFQTRPAD